MQKIKADYVVGLVDGEGSFTVYIRDPDSKELRKRRTRAEPKFYLKLIKKDRDILYKLMDFFGCGNVYFQKDRRKNHQDCYRYEVSNRSEIKDIIIPFFRKNNLQLSSKKKDFRIFCKIFEEIDNGKHLTNKGLKQLYFLKKKMH